MPFSAHLIRLKHRNRLNRSAGLTSATALAAVLVVSGCSASVSSGSGISKTKVAQQISDSLLKQTGHRPTKVGLPERSARQGARH